jgi:molybdenum-dependent DNA-binding transcriptional regulator ModE
VDDVCLNEKIPDALVENERRGKAGGEAKS